MEWNELFEKIKKYLIISQDTNSNFIEYTTDLPNELFVEIMTLKIKEEKVYTKLVKEYIEKESLGLYIE